MTDTSYFVRVDTPRVITLPAFDRESDPLTFSIVTPPTQGTLDDCTTGTCTYSPAAGFVGADSFQYTASDATTTSGVATVTLTVVPVQAPQALNATVQTKVDEPLGVELTTRAAHHDPSALVFTVVTPPTNGTLGDCTVGVCTYTPDPGFAGTDSIQFTVSDGAQTSNVATIVIEVLASQLQATALSASLTPTDLATTLAGSGVTISNVTYTGANAGGGRFTGGLASIGFDAGVVLSSGSVVDVKGPNSQPGKSTNLGAPGDAALTALAGIATHDASILQFNVTPTSSQLVFRYVFASEEYNEYVYSYNDAFALFVNGTNCAFVDDDPVTINNVNGGKPFGAANSSHPESFRNNETKVLDTEMDGVTVVLSCVAAVNAGVSNTVRLAIADASDSSFDSVVFIEAGSLQANTPPVADAKSVSTSERVPVPVTLTGSDADLDPITFRVVNGPANGTLSGTAPNLTYTPNTGFFGTDTFTYVVNDGFVDSAVATVTIVVADNLSPTVDAGSPASGVEGSAIGLVGSVSDPESDALTSAWTYAPGVGVDAGATCTFSATTSVSTSIACTDDGTYVATLTASDGINTPVTDTVTVTVSNAAPTVSITTPVNAASFVVGATVAVSATVVDPGSNDSHTCSIDWGDGTSGPGVLVTGVCAGSHVYASEATGANTITVTAVDDDAASGSDSVAITILNQVPTVDAGSAASGVEGSAIALAGSASDPEGDPLTLAWAYAPGVGVDAGATCTFSAPTSVSTSITCTDDGSYTATLSAADGFNAAVSDTVTVTVSNAAPTVSITTPVNAASFVVGATVAVSATVDDQGSNDSHSCSIDWGDGTTEPGVLVGGVCSGSHVYASAATGSNTIIVTAVDDDAATGSDTIGITIVNQAPVIDAGPAVTGVEGSTIALGGSASDPDGDALTSSWTYTPGAGVDAGSTCVFADATAVSTSITCTDDGEYTATLTADDGFNDPVTDTVTVTVSNAAPTVSITTPADAASFVLGEMVSVSATVVDPGSNDTHSCSIDWGDGTTEPGVLVSGTCSGSHVYASAATGANTITVTALDDDDASGIDSAAVEIVNQVPVVDAGPAVTGVEGSVIALVGSVSDPEGDELTLAWTSAPGAGVDAGATCTFSSTTSVSTSITCSDDGSFAATLSVSDGTNTPVTDTVTVTVSNAVPTVSITTPASGASFLLGESVSVSATIADPGSNDSHSCTIDWGDATTTSGTLTAGVCTGSHVYASAATGSSSIVVTAVDDDGASGLDTVDITVVAPPPSTGSISGLVFSDLDRDGVRDVGEPGIANVRVTVASSGAGLGAVPQAAFGDVPQSELPAVLLTDAEGRFVVPGLPPGTYVVTVDASSVGMQATSVSSMTVVVVAGATNQDPVFGIAPAQSNSGGLPATGAGGTTSVALLAAMASLSSLALAVVSRRRGGGLDKRHISSY